MSIDDQNATIYAGDDAVLNISIVDNTGKGISLAGASFVWTLSPSAGQAAILTKSTGGGGVVLTRPLAGRVAVNLSHTATANLSGPLWHQLVMTDAAGNVSTVTTGTLTFKKRT